MAMNTNNRTKAPKAKESNAVVYKVTMALVLLCVGLVALRAVNNYYATIGGMEFFDPLLPYMIFGGLGLCVVCAVALAFWKNTIARTILPWFVFLFAMGVVTAASMKLEFTEGFPMLYFLWAAALVQYIIYQLYRWEFFLFSLPTVLSGFLFYQLRNGSSTSFRNILPLIITVLVLLAVLLIALITSRNKGCLTLGSVKFHLFSKRYSPILHYLVCALWIVCILAALLLGSLFAHYCMYAAIAVEFIAAVYYTFQLN